jgi:hypothetical protein
MSQPEHDLAPIHRLPDPEIERLLVTGERREELKAMLGDDAYRELSRLARRAAATRPRARRPVYVLPGLMGSRIGTHGRLLDDVLWVDVVEIAGGRLVRLALPARLEAHGAGRDAAQSLKLKLSLQIAGFNAKFHAFDWRLGIDALAQELVERRTRARRGCTARRPQHWAAWWRARPSRWRMAGSRGVVQIGARPTSARSLPCSRCAVSIPPCKLAALDLEAAPRTMRG